MVDVTDLTLGQRQRLFSALVAKLIVWALTHGYELTFGETTRDPRIAKLNEEAGLGISNSLHYLRLAVDFNLFIKGKYQTSSDAHKPLGEYWKSLHPLCCWGGDFKKPDGNHYSITYRGVR